ncbi:SbcC/MukB-like Walker B domain-containing protein, partial [Cellulomonas shaoxiangyii]
LAGRAHAARERADATLAAGADVRRAATTLERRVADAVPVARMAGLAAGTGSDNAHALSLATYVLARRFEDVVDAANDRLRVMSDGRYELARSDEKEDVRTRTTGLSMRVLDHRTEQARDPRTLSGGETFYVSLCLALGMADVVTAEAGGVELGTLFVDEGFGALDPHVLDQVLGELGRLRAGGRVVGVVSHVEALKQAVADRIEVRPTPSGPSTLTVRAG